MSGLGRSTRRFLATDLDGSDLFVSSLELDGPPGATVGIVAGVGAGEWLSVRVVHELHTQLLSYGTNGGTPAGSVRLVPVGNPLGFASLGSEVGPAGHQDALESEAGIPARTRAVLAGLLEGVDVAVELRCGSWGTATCGVTFAAPPTPAVEALLSNLPGPPVTTSLDDPRDASGSRLALAPLVARGVPVVSYAVGGAGVGASAEVAWVAEACAALLAWLRAAPRGLGAPPSLASPVQVSPTTGGLLEPSRSAQELLGTEVAAGTVLATIRSPYSFAELEQLTAPVDGTLVRVAVAHPVRPGEPAFALAPPAG